MIKVSVVMSIYKEPVDWLKQSIDSILNQTFKDFEFIIICDNPEYYEGITLLNEYCNKDSRIVVILNNENIGLTKSLNKGIAIAKGEYLARMDADDISMPNRLFDQLRYMEINPRVLLSHSNCYNINTQGDIISIHYDNTFESNQELLVMKNPIIHTSVMFRKELLSLRNPFYNEYYRCSQDYELWTFLCMKDVKFGYIREPLVCYRYSDTQISRKGKSKQRNNFIQIRYNYLISRLGNIGVNVNYKINLETLFKVFKQKESEFGILERRYILYLLYYNLSKKVTSYQIKYLLDRNKLWNFFGFKKSLYIFLHPFVGEKRWPWLCIYSENA